ncbi:MAG: D-glycerate dehydrogenase, partial [Ignavibacteriaceae bacterium]|nr:D-glycerate dehydrogenase [Ignavibacteriaceae bacterium]
ALISLLKRNRIRAVGLDVFENEPSLNPKLLNFANVIVLPHLGSATEEARSRMAELAVKNVINVFNRKAPLTPVY